MTVEPFKKPFSSVSEFGETINEDPSKTSFPSMLIFTLALLDSRFLSRIVYSEPKGRDITQKGKFVPRSQSYVEALRSMLGMHGFLATGSFQSAFGGIDTIKLSFQMAKLNVPLKKFI